MRASVEAVIDGVLAAKDIEDRDVRVFRDMNGDVSIATLDDVCIEPNEDKRVALVSAICNNYEWAEDSDFPSNIEGYEGSLNALASSVLSRILGRE